MAAVTAASQTSLNSSQKRAEALLKQMTLDEKIGQLTQLGALDLMPDPIKIEERVRKSQAGSILWLSDPASVNHLQKIAVDETRLHVPMLFGLDVIHGFRTVFPVPLAMAASWDMNIICLLYTSDAADE